MYIDSEILKIFNYIILINNFIVNKEINFDFTNYLKLYFDINFF